MHVCCSVAEKYGNTYAYIGLTKTTDLCGSSDDDRDLDCRRRGWTWADGTTYNYPGFHDWLDDDPDPGDLCAILYQSSSNGWYGVKCFEQFYYICEKGN